MRYALLLLSLLFLCAVRPVGAAPAANTLAGVKIGMDRDDAHAVLIAQGASSQGKDKHADPDKDKHADPDEVQPEVWMLKSAPYEKIVFAADDDDKILWVTGFTRAGQGIPFARLGNLAHAAASGPAFAVWNVISPRGSYREIARGSGGRAMTVSLLPLKNADPNGVFSHQIIPNAPSKTTPKTGTGEHP